MEGIELTRRLDAIEQAIDAVMGVAIEINDRLDSLENLVMDMMPARPTSRPPREA